MSSTLPINSYQQPYFGFHKVGDVAVSKNGKFQTQEYRFSPSTFEKDWNERYPDLKIKHKREFNSSVIYNDAAQELKKDGKNPKRKGWNRFGAFGIKMYQLGTRFNKVPVLGWVSRTLMSSDRCYHGNKGELSCSEMGLVMMDQLAQSGKFKDFLKACSGIKDYLVACSQGSLSEATPHKLEKPFLRVWNWIRGKSQDAPACEAPILKEYTYTLKEKVQSTVLATA